LYPDFSQRWHLGLASSAIIQQFIFLSYVQLTAFEPPLPASLAAIAAPWNPHHLMTD
jgi:hypothetical protein